MAREVELDLVEVSPNAKPPVCKIMDYGKFRYERTKKEHLAQKKQHQVKVKEIRISAKIGEHDLNVKIRNAREMLIGGDRVDFILRFKGRGASSHRNSLTTGGPFGKMILPSS